MASSEARQTRLMLTSGTALVLIFTQQGFVFAADGLELDTFGKARDRSSRKIFPLRREVAFSCAGFRSVRNGKTKFELPRTVCEAFEQAAKSFSGDFKKLAEEMGARVRAELVELKEQKIIESYPKNEYADWFARILLAGFFDGKPNAAQLSFCCLEGAVVCQLEIRDVPGSFAYAGPETVWTALVHNSDAKVAPYRKEAFDKMGHSLDALDGPNLEEATLVAQNYVRACSDPAVHKAYPECKAIGGNMQSATITLEKGFFWM
ncbi:MAG TPA: hypothetical protein VJN92_20720 [Candidatus Acidoferrum sp.]|nr:hypothetical protein [Candidatus Acidoferrum sp.]